METHKSVPSLSYNLFGTTFLLLSYARKLNRAKPVSYISDRLNGSMKKTCLGVLVREEKLHKLTNLLMPFKMTFISTYIEECRL